MPGLKSLHICVDMLGQMGTYLSTGLRQLLKVTEASVTVVLGGYEKVRNEGWKCAKWSEDHKARFADTASFRLQRPATSTAEIGHVQTTGEVKYSL